MPFKGTLYLLSSFESKNVRKVMGLVFIVIGGVSLGGLFAKARIFNFNRPDPVKISVPRLVVQAPKAEGIAPVKVTNLSGASVQINGMVRTDCLRRVMCKDLPLELAGGETELISVSVDLPSGVGRWQVPFVVYTDRGQVTTNCVLFVDVVAPRNGSPTLAPPLK